MARITLRSTADELSLVSLWECYAGGGEGGGAGGMGFIYFEDVSVPGGTASGKTWQDPPGNTILETVTVSALTINVTVRSSFPKVKVYGTYFILPRISGGEGEYGGTLAVTLTGPGPVQAIAITPNDQEGAHDTIEVSVQAPPTITLLSFTGEYPGAQTELKEDDQFSLQVGADRNFDQVQILDFGASKAKTISVPIGQSATVTIDAADRGDVAQLLTARVQVRDAVTGSYSATRDTDTGGGSVEKVNVVKLNDLRPTVNIGAVTYPIGQSALKGIETATVANTLSNYDSVLYDSPNGEVSPSNPVTFQNPKTVTRVGGSYNVTVPNFRIAATRNANASTTVAQSVVQIANVAAVVGVSESAVRLRSGGNDGTAAQDHTITITSDQQLLNAPSVDATANAGTFQGVWTGGPAVWTRPLRVHDDDLKGAFSWSNLVATNLAGIVTTAITGDSQYVLGGFVARTVTWDAFQTISRNINVMVVDFAKLSAGLFSATNQQSVKWPIGTAPPKTDGYTISALSVKPHTVTWLDTAAAGSNTGEAYLFTYQEAV
jgi:hypothetical protein